MALLSRLTRAGSLLIATVLVVGAGVRANPVAVTEAQAKAALLYNFLTFVDWPADVAERQSFVIGVAGDADVLEALRPINGQIVKARSVVIRDVREEDDPAECHVLYLAAARDRMTASILRRVVGTPVLTVGDGNEFAKRGGIIVVYFDQSRLRFDVSLVNASKAQLKISSKVLGLARSVRSDGTNE